MLRAIENMGIEMSFGIIFIGNGELSKKDYARYIEKHQLREVVQMKTILFIFLPFPLSNNSFVHSEQFQDMSELLCSFYYDFPSEEYILQSTSFLTSMREVLQVVKASPQYEKYQVRYESLVKQKKLTKGDWSICNTTCLSPLPLSYKCILFKVSKMKDQLCVQTANTSEEMFEYYVNTVQIMDMMRDAIVKLRRTMKDVIRTELYAVDREYIVGIGVLSIL